MKKPIYILLLLAAFVHKESIASEGLITPPPACPTIQTSGVNVSCNTSSNGSATVAIITASSGPYVYTWSQGTITSTAALSSTITNLSEGTYTVNIKDQTTGCVVVGAVVINAPDPISITGVSSSVNCFGAATGGVNVNVTGGTPGFSYSWAGPVTSTAEDLTNALAGSYTLTVTDSKSCTKTANFSITQPVEALNHSTIVSNADCNGTATGDIDLTVWGGTTPYAYSWSNGSLAQDLVNITQGNYVINVTDAKGCTLSDNITVSQPPVLAGTLSTSDVNCHGEATGSLFFTPVGGTSGYTYQWSNSTSLFSQTGASLLNVVADNYSVTVTDAKGCSYTTTGIVNQPPLLTLATTAVNVNCYGGSDGSIDLIVAGGTGPYSYVWTNALSAVVSNTQDLSSIPASNYTVVVSDNLGCTKTISQEVTEPSVPITVTEVVTDVLCYGFSTGVIDITVTGGTAPYSYNWSNSFVSEDLVNVQSGNYSYTVTDDNGCTYSNNLVIQQPAAPVAVTNSIVNVNCYGESNGSIDLTVSGGTTPYSYEWANSVYLLSLISQDLNNIPAETYNFIVTDANGCVVLDTLTVTQPTLLETSVTGVNILCKGGNNGSVDLTVVGGTLPYTYSWNTGGVTQDLSLLVAGSYSVTVTDDHSCTSTSSITLTEPLDSLEFSYSVTNVKCNDGTDGAIELVVTGGTVPYTYNWSNASSLASIEELTAGTYSFVVTDFNGCQVNDSMIVTQPDPLTLNELITPVTCYGLSDGIIDISPLGGTSPFNFTWFNSTFALSTQTEDLTGFPADIYQVEIIDSNNCFYEMFFEIIQPDSLQIDYTFTIVSCNGGSDGSILVDITGGNPTYTTTWSNGAITEDLLNIPADNYELVVVDTKGCTDSIEVEITQPDPITMTFEVTEISCIDQHDGKALALPIGGNSGYTYLWSNGEINALNENLYNQYYSITVTDILGCTGQDSVFIPKNNIECVSPVNAFSPNDDLYNDTWIIENMSLYPDAELQVFNKWGNLIHKQTGIYEPWDGVVNGEGLPSETYYYILNLNFEDRKPLTGNITIVR
jgi:gliding motility-associated-like protein